MARPPRSSRAYPAHSRHRQSAGFLAWLQEVGVPVNDPPLSILPAEQVRHPQRRLADLRGVIEPPSTALDIDRVRDVLVHAFKQILAVKPALGIPGRGPIQAGLDRSPALLPGAPAAEDHHIVRVGPQTLDRLSVTLDESPQGLQELLVEFIPIGHASLLDGPSTAGHSMPVGPSRRNDLQIRRSGQSRPGPSVTGRGLGRYSRVVHVRRVLFSGLATVLATVAAERC